MHGAWIRDGRVQLQQGEESDVAGSAREITARARDLSTHVGRSRGGGVDGSGFQILQQSDRLHPGTGARLLVETDSIRSELPGRTRRSPLRLAPDHIRGP